MKRIIIEQDAVLNQHLPQAELKPKITTLEAFCVFGAFLSPYAMISWVSFLAGRWLQDKPVEVLETSLHVFAMYVGILILLLLTLKITDKFSIHFKRRLWLHRWGINTTPGKYVPWRNLRGWHLTSVADRPDLTLLTLIINRGRRKLRIAHWRIILEKPSQIEIFQTYLQTRVQAGKEIPQQISEIPPLPVPEKIRPLGWLLISSGLCLFVSMLLPFSLAMMLVKRSNIDFRADMPKASSGNLETFIAAHFNSSHELGWTVICLGLLCTLLALALATTGQRLCFHSGLGEKSSPEPT